MFNIRFGKKSEKLKPVTLGPLMTDLMGGEEDQEMVVEASESGLAAIQAAESRLEAFNNEATEHESAVEAAEAAQATAESNLRAEQEAHQATTTAFEAFKKGPGATHTVVEKDGDEVQTGTPAPASEIRKGEAKAKAEGERIHKANKKD